MQLSTIDPHLPALAHFFETAAVAQGFTTHLPADDQASQAAPAPRAPWQVRQMHHLHYQPARHCIATYELSQTDPSQPPSTTIGVMEYTPAGFRYRLFQQDPTLPGLATAVDGATMAERLATLAPPNNKTARPSRCTITPIRYRPGQRCALRYTLQLPSAPHSFFGKLFHQTEEQRITALPALHSLTTTTPTLPRLPQPLAYWPDLQLLLQPRIEGTEFHAHVFSEATPIQERVMWFQRLGGALAALHQVTTQALPHRPITTNLAELAEYTPIVAQIMPALATAYGATVQDLTTAAQGLPAVSPVVCHGALRTDQWLISQELTAGGTTEQLMLIDLDTLCLANPACDLSNCLAYLTWKAERQPHYAAFIEAAAAALLTGYGAVQPLPPAPWLALYRAIALLKIAGRRFRSLSQREWALTPQLVQSAQTIVATHLQ